MNVNYIYNKTGQIEYAVIPYYLWDTVKEYIEKIEIKENKKTEKLFKPQDYKGILSHYKFNIEDELVKIRNEWSRTF